MLLSFILLVETVALRCDINTTYSKFLYKRLTLQTFQLDDFTNTCQNNNGFDFFLNVRHATYNRITFSILLN